MFKIFKLLSWFFGHTEKTAELALHEKPYFSNPGVSWKAQKDQVNIIFPSKFWLKKDPISHLWKIQNKDLPVVSKYHLSINFLVQKRPYFHLRKVQNKNFSVINKHGNPFYRKHHVIVFWELKDHLSRFLKYHASFVNTTERSFYQLPALKEIFFYSQKSIISTFSSSEKFLIWTFSFVQSSCFCNNFFLTFIETYNMFHYKKKYEAESRDFF